MLTSLQVPTDGRRRPTPLLTYAMQGDGAGAAAAAATTWAATFQVPATGSAGTLQCYHTGSHAEHQRLPCLLLLHGANYSAAVFRFLLPLLRAHFFVVAYDARGHGASAASARHDADSAAALSAGALTDDCLAVVAHVARHFLQPGAPLVLGGHSLGAAIALRATRQWGPHLPPLAAVTIFDFVEGAARDDDNAALAARMPHGFGSLDDAIEWATSEGVLRLRSVAAAVLPSTLRPVLPPEAAAWPPDLAVFPRGAPPALRWVASELLRADPTVWRACFEGCNAAFLALPCPQLLLLAGGADRMVDPDMIVAQMQGKYTLKVIAASGHVVMADAPDKVAAEVFSFCSRAGLLATSEGALLEARLKRAREAASAATVGVVVAPPPGSGSHAACAPATTPAAHGGTSV